MTKKKEQESIEKVENCPKCGSLLGEIVILQDGRRVQRCSTGRWNEEIKKVEGCPYVRWLSSEPQTLDEACPKCGKSLVLVVTRSGKKVKRCSTNVWDPQTKTSSGCDYVDWIKGTTEELDEACPTCGEKLVLFTTSTGKKLKKCSTNKWDKEQKKAMGCSFAVWM